MDPDLAMDTADQKLLKSTGAGNPLKVINHYGDEVLEVYECPAASGGD